MSDYSPRRPVRHWPALTWRAMRLLMRPRARTGELVTTSYDTIAGGYDDAWTHHMRDLSIAMLDRLAVPAGGRCVDLTCGTGFVTAELARRAETRPTGVDASAGMIAVARRRYGADCDFVHADAVAYLRSLPPASADVVTCGWGLGYTRPAAVVRQIARVLRPGGRVGIIDNSLFSLAGVLWASIKTFAERPAALTHVMNVRFLPNAWTLASLCHLHGLSVRWRANGARTYTVPDGRTALERLTATGAAAGFEFACGPADREAVFGRFAEVMDAQAKGGDVAITHRWLAVVGAKA